MTEIVVQNGHYKFYEGYMTFIAIEFFLTYNLVVDIWLCPIAMFVAHTYLLVRFKMYFDTPDVLIPGLYCPLVFHILTWYLINIHLKKDFLLVQMQQNLIERFFHLLQAFPERIVISKRGDNGNTEYPFTNDDTLKEMFQGNQTECREDIIRT